MAPNRAGWFLLLILIELSGILTASNSTQSDEVEISNCGVGFELIQKRMEFLQYKFLELSVNVMEFGESVVNRQRSIEEQMFHLENSVIANLSLVTSYSRQILDLQTICSNHERIRNELMRYHSDSSKIDEIKNFTPCSKEVTTVQPKSSEAPESDSTNSCNKHSSSSGFVNIQIPNIAEQVQIFCEMTTVGGGWIVIQQRKDNSTCFHRGWTEYRNGFGQPATNFWIGLEKLYQLTSRDQYELFIEVQFSNGTVGNAYYTEFRVGSEGEKYVLAQLGRYSGTVHDAMRAHKGSPFSTYDRWNGPSDATKWAQSDKGGWWYYNSYESQLNSGIGSTYGMYWKTSHLKFSRMMIRKK